MHKINNCITIDITIDRMSPLLQDGSGIAYFNEDYSFEEFKFNSEQDQVFYMEEYAQAK